MNELREIPCTPEQWVEILGWEEMWVKPVWSQTTMTADSELVVWLRWDLTNFSGDEVRMVVNGGGFVDLGIHDGKFACRYKFVDGWANRTASAIIVRLTEEVTA